jgi:hypothetical protein
MTEEKKKKSSGIIPILIGLIILGGMLFIPMFPSHDADGNKRNGSISYAGDLYGEFKEMSDSISNDSVVSNATIFGHKIDKKTGQALAIAYIIFSLFMIALGLILVKIYKRKAGVVINAFVSYMMLAMVSIIMLLGSFHAKYSPGVNSTFAQSAAGNLSSGFQALYSVGQDSPDLWIILCIGMITIGFYYYFIDEVKEGLDKIKTAKQLLEEVSANPDKYLKKEDKE